MLTSRSTATAPVAIATNFTPGLDEPVFHASDVYASLASSLLGIPSIQLKIH